MIPFVIILYLSRWPLVCVCVCVCVFPLLQRSSTALRLSTVGWYVWIWIDSATTVIR